VVGGAELLRDGLEGQAVDEDGAQGGVAAMQGLVGFQEEALARGVVHEGAPHGG
jgi:hypothetical protein